MTTTKKFQLTNLKPGQRLASYNEKVQTDSATFFRQNSRVIVVSESETTVDEYADVAAAKLVMEMARNSGE
jgi:hypothetical protein